MQCGLSACIIIITIYYINPHEGFSIMCLGIGLIYKINQIDPNADTE